MFKRDNFTHPICIDEKDAFNKLNYFPKDMAFQTFQLDKDNKVIAIGNPVHNPKIKELYLKIIMGDKASQKEVKAQTDVALLPEEFIVGKATFVWKSKELNTGNMRWNIVWKSIE